MKLHHVAIAVQDLKSSINTLEKILDVKFSSPENVESQKVLVAFGENMELVQATQDYSPQFPMIPHPIKSFIDKNGEGLHHLCFEVADLDSALLYLRGKGIEPISKEPMAGSGGSRIIFLNPKHCGGTLIELKEVKRDG